VFDELNKFTMITSHGFRLTLHHVASHVVIIITIINIIIVKYDGQKVHMMTSVIYE